MVSKSSNLQKSTCGILPQKFKGIGKAGLYGLCLGMNNVADKTTNRSEEMSITWRGMAGHGWARLGTVGHGGAGNHPEGIDRQAGRECSLNADRDQDGWMRVCS